MSLEAENEKPAMITDHKFCAPKGEPWNRCKHCGLAEAAHIETRHGPYKTPHRQPYRCPDCVTTNKATCTHRRK
jgi:hypothetical protein